ncbi:MAG: T9SS type A sorting domain-containing protein [Bacteroidota bacterium]
MKNFYLICCFLFLFQYSKAQEWQEHFSHDRNAYSHHGQFVVDGQIVLFMGNWEGPTNTLETLTGNVKKDVIVVSPNSTYERIKTTTLGIGEKEILILRPFSYDIYGYGIYSVRKQDDAFSIRDIYTIEGQSPYHVLDAYLPLDSTQNNECITDESEWIILDKDDNILDKTDLNPLFFFHETADKLFQIEGGKLIPRADPDHISGIELDNVDMIENDPYRNNIAVIYQNEMWRYSIEDCGFLRMDLLEDAPMVVNFSEDGFYYLVDNEDSYIVYHYNDELLSSEVWYEYIKAEELDNYDISNFEVIEDDIYFFGILERSDIETTYSYVQKRNRSLPFEPLRKDLSLDSFSVVGFPEGPNPWNDWDFEYSFTVTNNSSETVNYFSLYSTNMAGLNSIPKQLINQTINIELAPGESYKGSGKFFFHELTSITLHLVGADFALDSNIDDNSLTADIITLTNKEISSTSFNIGPNPVSNRLHLMNGDINEIEFIYISDISGHKIKVPENQYRKIDTNNLPQGKYWLEIKTISVIEKHPFVKI